MKKLAVILSLLLFASACSDRNRPEQVAEDFVYNYYKRANQETALLLSASLATKKLDDEIERLRTVRKPGEELDELPQIKSEMVGKKGQEDGNQVLFRYRLTIQDDRSTTPPRNVIIHTELIDGRWKVINFDEYSD